MLFLYIIIPYYSILHITYDIQVFLRGKKELNLKNVFVIECYQIPPSRQSKYFFIECIINEILQCEMGCTLSDRWETRLVGSFIYYLRFEILSQQQKRIKTVVLGEQKQNKLLFFYWRCVFCKGLKWKRKSECVKIFGFI